MKENKQQKETWYNQERIVAAKQRIMQHKKKASDYTLKWMGPDEFPVADNSLSVSRILAGYVNCIKPLSKGFFKDSL